MTEECARPSFRDYFVCIGAQTQHDGGIPVVYEPRLTAARDLHRHFRNLFMQDPFVQPPALPRSKSEKKFVVIIVPSARLLTFSLNFYSSAFLP